MVRGAGLPPARRILAAAAAAAALAAHGWSDQGGGADEAFARGMGLFKSGDFAAAAAAFREAAGLREGFLEAHYYLGKSLHAGKPIDYAGAEAQFLTVLRLQPDHTDGRIALASTYFEWGRYDRSAALLEEVLRRFPDHRGALYFSGVMAARRGEHEKAVSFLQRALTTDPRYIKARLELGLALSHLSREEEALSAFEAVLKADPNNTSALMGAGTSLKRLGREEEARKRLLRFRELATAQERNEMKEGRIRLWLNATRKHFTEGRMAEARKAVDQLLAEYPDEPRGLASLGYLQEKAGEDAAALATYEKVLRIEPENLTANYGLVGLYLRAGQREKARAQKARYDEFARKASAEGRD
jgi:tetratricopeptide (TPR) repeat protein